MYPGSKFQPELARSKKAGGIISVAAKKALTGLQDLRDFDNHEACQFDILFIALSCQTIFMHKKHPRCR
jgi:hypothetical protein